MRRVWLSLLLLTSPGLVVAADPPDFNTHVLPVFRKYCNGCHNDKDAEGGLVLASFAAALKGGDNGASIIAGKSADSRLWKLLTGVAEPKMPPEDQPAPRPEELALIRAWIDAGAKAPVGRIEGLVTPTIRPTGPVREPITSLAHSPNGRWVAVARPNAIEVLNVADQQPVSTLNGHTGAINEVSFSRNSQWLLVAAGEVGLQGEATLWKTADWSREKVFRGHRDALYSAQLNPDDSLLATSGYDKQIVLWNVATGETARTLAGHNDAVYSLAFHPAGKLLASASGDRTVKLWDVASGERLETFSQPAKEQATVAASPDGRLIVAGGADNRIRVWEITQGGKEGTNPLRYARFAHEGPILRVVFSPDGKLLASSAEDRRIKLWETDTFTQVAVLDRQSDWAAALAFSADSRRLAIGRMNGELEIVAIDPRWAGSRSNLKRLTEGPTAASPAGDRPLLEVVEHEPNDTPAEAQALSLPATVSGSFAARPAGDSDLYRINASAGESWILETSAARNNSKADTRIEILRADGAPVVRALLQAVRDSWINFRPIDSNQADVRVEYWEEMDLNQYLYMNGEIGKTFRAPQGPDSAYQLYFNSGKRRCYFDTSAVAHAKDEPVYIVEAYPPGSSIVENGLPVFPLYYANDDDAQRELGSDSRLTFTVPQDGAYLVRVTDNRGFGGEGYGYSLTVRPPKPDFAVNVNSKNPKIPAGSGQRLSFSVDRTDGFDGDIQLEIGGLPSGFSAETPVVIPAGHLETRSVLHADEWALQPSEQEWSRVAVTASAVVGGETIRKSLGNLGEIKLEKPAAIRVFLEPDDSRYTTADGGLAIVPGTTITARIRVERHGFDGDVKFDVDNLPHGIIVDNIGLSGVLVRAKETERQIFLTARPWVPATTRLIHAVAQTQGNQATPPIRLTVRGGTDVAGQ